MNGLIEVFAAKDVPEVYAAKAVLEEWGIKVHLADENLQLVLSEQPPQQIPPRLLVVGVEAKKASTILERYCYRQAS